MSKNKKRQKQTAAKGAGRSSRQSRKNSPPQLRKRKGINRPLVALAGAGMLLTLYLTLNIWLGGTPLYCDEGSSCDIVQQSHWGTFLGLPTAFWGFWVYLTLAFIGLKVRAAERHWKLSWFISALGLSYSLYLTAISVFVIDAVCAYCVVSLSLMAAIFGVVVSQRPEGMQKFKMKVWAAETVVVALVFVGVMQLHYSGVFDPAAGPGDPYLTGLAKHLSKNDAVLYGAFW